MPNDFHRPIGELQRRLERVVEAVAVLAPDAVTLGDGGGVAPASNEPIEGALPVARFAAGLFRRFVRQAARAHLELVLLNGDFGLMVKLDMPGQRLTATMAAAVADGRITGIFNQLNPAKLTRLPAPDPDRALDLHA